MTEHTHDWAQTSDGFAPVEGGGAVLYRPLDRSQRVTWPEVDRRTHPANNVRPLVERRGPRASRFNDLEKA
jgi:hypothetical protein